MRILASDIYSTLLAQIASESYIYQTYTVNVINPVKNFDINLLEGISEHRSNDQNINIPDVQLSAIRMTPLMINDFNKEWQIIDHTPDTSSGFSATLLRNNVSNEYTIAFRSAESKSAELGGDRERDGPNGADGEVFNFGLAFAQVFALLHADTLNTSVTFNAPGISTLTGVLQEQSEHTTRLHSLAQEIASNLQKQQHQSIRAPVTGVVQQLAVNTIGGAITAAQKLMIIAPESDSIEIEAFLENKDIGFVNEGQSAEIKVDTFSFTKYGTINGRIRTLSKDAVAREDLGWAFATHVAIDQTGFNLDGKVLPVLPGMSVQVEIKTGSRKLIEFVLSPALKGLDDSARER